MVIWLRRLRQSGGSDLAWDSSLMEWILGGMVYEDSCGRVWPCIGGEFHDFFIDLELP